MLGLVATLLISSLVMLAPPAAAEAPAHAGRGYVAITFDDCWNSVYDYALPLLTSYNIPATAYAITSAIGEGDYMSAERLLSLQSAGWEIGSHTATHADLTAVSLEDATAELADSKAALEAQGINVTTMAYPYGTNNANVRAAAAELYERQRTTDATDMMLRHFPASVRTIGCVFPATMASAMAYIDAAVRTDSVVVLNYHKIASDGTLDTADYTLHDLAEYITDRRTVDGLDVLRITDLSGVGTEDLYEWTAAADGALTTGANWAGGVAPSAGDSIILSHRSAANITIDSSVEFGDIQCTVDYTGTVKQGSSPIGYHDLYLRSNITFSGDDVQTCGGSHRNYGAMNAGGHLTMAGDGGLLRIGSVSGNLKNLTFVGDTYIYRTVATDELNIGDGVSVFVRTPGLLHNNNLIVQTNKIVNRGTIIGNGGEFWVYTRTATLDFGAVSADMAVVGNSWGIGSNMVATITGDQVIGGALRAYSSHTTYALVLDLNGHDLVADGATAGIRGSIGNGTVYTYSWDSTAGGLLSNTNVVLRDGGSAVLAPGQSFNALQIASVDKRTASWNMTATGTIAPTVTGLESGVSYLWYLDGVEQGEIEADENGTIALAYESTGLHELSIGPTQMTVVMDSMYGAVSVMISLFALAAVLSAIGGLFGKFGDSMKK